MDLYLMLLKKDQIKLPQDSPMPYIPPKTLINQILKLNKVNKDLLLLLLEMDPKEFTTLNLFKALLTLTPMKKSK
jgi:hypothetical protein